MCLRSLSHSLLERLGLVRFFPRDCIQIIDTSEMTVVGCFAIDRTKQIELLDDFCRFEVENFPDRPLKFFFVDFAGTESIDADANGLGMTDGVGELNFTSIRQTGGHDILRYPAAHVSRATIYLRGILSGKRAAAVPSHSAVCVADDFAACDACVAFRAPDYEPARWIH